MQCENGYEDYFVAYFDILGFKSDIENFHMGYVLEQYREVLRILKKEYADAMWFSDSFVLYTKIDTEKSICGGVDAAQSFFHEMFKRYIPLRGCMNIGGFYVDSKKGIFFGPCLNKAYKLAENQNWIGLVLTEVIKERLKGLKVDDQSVWDILNKQFIEYEVPFKKEIENCKLQTYNFKILLNSTAADEVSMKLEKESEVLFDALNEMKFKYELLCRENKKGNGEKFNLDEEDKVKVKYENTKKFLLTVFPNLIN